MNEYIITGTGIVSGIGSGTIDSVMPRTTGVFDSRDGSKSATAISVDSSVVTNFIEPAKLRRVDHFSKMALTACCISIDQAKLDTKLLENCGLILVSGFGPVNSICAFKDSYFVNGAIGASPTLFTKSVQNQACSNVATFCGIGGIITTICQQNGAVQSGLLTAFTWLEEKRVQRVILVAVDELCPVIEYHKTRCGDNRVSGEGATAIILEKTGCGLATVSINEGSCMDRSKSGKMYTDVTQDTEKLKMLSGSFPTFNMVELFFAIQSMKKNQDGIFVFENSSPFLSKLTVRKKAV